MVDPEFKQTERRTTEVDTGGVKIVGNTLMGQLAAQRVNLVAIAVEHIIAAQAILLGLAMQFIAVEHQLLAIQVL